MIGNDGNGLFRYIPVTWGAGAAAGLRLFVLRALRGRGDATPVIVLTARDALTDKVAGEMSAPASAVRCTCRPPRPVKVAQSSEPWPWLSCQLVLQLSASTRP